MQNALKSLPSWFLSSCEKKYHIYNCYMAKNEIIRFNPLINPLFFGRNEKNVWLQHSTMQIQHLQTKPCQHKSHDLIRAPSKSFYNRQMTKQRRGQPKNHFFLNKKVLKTTDLIIPQNQQYQKLSRTDVWTYGRM